MGKIGAASGLGGLEPLLVVFAFVFGFMILLVVITACVFGVNPAADMKVRTRTVSEGPPSPPFSASLLELNGGCCSLSVGQ